MTDSPTLPLCVDLDGTVIRTDSLVESVLELVRQRPLSALLAPFWLLKGKAGFKSEIASRVTLPPETLPYREDLVKWLRDQARVRKVYLVTAAHHSIAESVANYLGCFAGVIATRSVNLSAHNKAKALAEQFGDGQFDYVGNSKDDLPVWQKARNAIVAGASASVAGQVRSERSVEREFDTESLSAPSVLLSLLRALRLHHWVKNLLVFLVPVGAHRLLDAEVLEPCLLAFLTFGMAASGTYVINDLLDLTADRLHPRKKLRPFAAGDVPLTFGLLVGSALLALALFIGLTVGRGLTLLVGTYIVSTLLYSTWLKRLVFVDVAMLAGFYVLRVVAGAAASDIGLSFWLLSVCAYGFLSLALMKRYIEVLSLGGQFDAAPARGYKAGDGAVVMALGVGTGLVCSLVMALYIDSPTSRVYYSHPDFLWMLVVLVIMGTGRLWLVAGRGEMHDDPLVFVARDPASLALLAAAALAVMFAI